MLAAALAVCAAAAVLRRARIPTPVVLVVAGVVVSFTPVVPDVLIEPKVVLLGLLPVLVFHAAYASSPRAMAAEGHTIAMLAVGLVVVTAVAAAVVAHLAVGLSWPLSFVLGTAIGPTDAAAPASIASGLGLPSRLVTIIEGESLLNDTTALVLYATAVDWAVSGRPLHLATLGLLLYSAVSAAAIGLAVGALGHAARRRLDDPPVEVVLKLLLAYTAYLPAEAIGASGVLAAVVAGLYLGWHDPESATARARLQASVFFDALVFMIEAVLFTEVGLSLHAFAKNHDDAHPWRLLVAGAALAGCVVVVRIGWVLLATRIPGPLRRMVATAPSAGGQRGERHLLAWAGMRGAITLAAALAVPTLDDQGKVLAGRTDLVYLAFAVIFATLVGQGLTLPALARRIASHVPGQLPTDEREARAELARVALERLDRDIASCGLAPVVTGELRSELEKRIHRIEQFGGNGEGEVDELELERCVRLDLLGAQRHRLLQLRSDQRVSAATMRELQHELDLEETRLSPRGNDRSRTREASRREPAARRG